MVRYEFDAGTPTLRQDLFRHAHQNCPGYDAATAVNPTEHTLGRFTINNHMWLLTNNTTEHASSLLYNMSIILVSGTYTGVAEGLIQVEGSTCLLLAVWGVQGYLYIR